uniref:Uncharacterized protein n=1 Tax=Cacopsylla melanoneura TaxID=428564 RepID=A0A8D8W5X1_9HEMI
MLQRTYSRVHSSHCIEGHRSTSIIDGVEAVWAISIHVKDSVDVLTFFPVDTDRRLLMCRFRVYLAWWRCHHNQDQATMKMKKRPTLTLKRILYKLILKS